MEPQPYFLVIAILVFTILYFLAKYVKARSTNLPPGPWKLPIIGNIHQLALAGPLPHRAFRELAKKYGPIMHLKLGENSTVVISSAKLAKEVLKTQDACFQKRPFIAAVPTLVYGPADIAFSPSGDYWRDMRKICTLELLSVKKVQSLVASTVREAEAEKLIQTIRESAGSRINLSDMIFSLISASVYRATFGSYNKEHDEFVVLIKEAMEILGGFHWADLFPSMKPLYYLSGLKSKVEKLHKKLDRILEDIVMEHQKKQREGRIDAEEEDLVDVLLRVQQSSSLTIANVKAVIEDMFAAGTDTTASTIEWAKKRSIILLLSLHLDGVAPARGLVVVVVQPKVAEENRFSIALLAGEVYAGGGAAAFVEIVVVDGGVDNILGAGTAAVAVEKSVIAVDEADVSVGVADQGVGINISHNIWRSEVKTSCDCEAQVPN
ncbi:cytochrome P450 71D8-like [Arachis duranensis]|uniref:Cytochrome P450 71D8-like n=1 Tax=Arachis duranensis TaxID=130453 RepID=A0A9C6TM33_ARADU|nr:cytochrome P450 71D8-like [Arachis duranensis]